MLKNNHVKAADWTSLIQGWLPPIFGSAGLVRWSGNSEALYKRWVGSEHRVSKQSQAATPHHQTGGKTLMRCDVRSMKLTGDGLVDYFRSGR
jgi:hypothetical protein